MANRVSTRELGLILAARLLKTEHLHYGLWRPDLEVTAANLPRAQEAYVERLLAMIPAGVRTILDVGCGTGGVAQRLLAAGYTVEAISPSPPLTELVRRKLGPHFQVYSTTLEGFNASRTYDLVLFSESFQYVPLRESLPKVASLLAPGGHALICDFFATDVPGTSALRGGHRLSTFRALLTEHPFRVVADDDVTPAVAPNLALVDAWLTDYALPVWETLGYWLRARHPWLARLGRRLFRRRLERLAFKYFSHQRTPETFARFKSYRFILLQRTEAPPP